MFSAVILHDRKCLVDHEVSTRRKVANRLFNQFGIRRFSAPEQILNAFGAMTDGVEQRKRIAALVRFEGFDTTPIIVAVFVLVTIPQARGLGLSRNSQELRRAQAPAFACHTGNEPARRALGLLSCNREPDRNRYAVSHPQ